MSLDATNQLRRYVQATISSDRINRYRRVALTDSVITVHTRKMQRRLSIMQIINNT